MATIQEKLSVLANTMDRAEGLSSEQLAEEKNKITVVDFKMVTFSLSGKDYAIDIMKVKEIAKAGRLLMFRMLFLLSVVSTICVAILFRLLICAFSSTAKFMNMMMIILRIC